MSIQNDKLAELVSKARNNDSESIRILYEEFYDEVYFISFKILSSKENAEDITQDTFIEAFTNINALQNPLSFRKWIGRIAANKSINFLKRMNRISLRDNDQMDTISYNEEIGASFENRIIQEDVKEILTEIIMKLPEEQRTILFLYYYQGMSVREIAELYGCSENTVKSRLRYARLFMKQEIEKLEDKGYQLRCISAMPFLYALFKSQKGILSVTGKIDIISMLNTGNNSTGEEMFAEGRKVISMEKKTKTILIAVIAAAVVGGAAMIGVMTNRNSGTVQTESSTTSAMTKVSEESAEITENSETSAESSTEESSESSYESSEEEESSLESSEDLTVWSDWKYEDVNQPTVKNSEYITKKILDDTVEVTTATPTYTVDYDKAEKFIKENDMFKDLKFASSDLELTGLMEVQDYGLHSRYSLTKTLLGYFADPEKTDEKPTSDYSNLNKVTFESRESAYAYNKPYGFTLKINDPTLNQEELYNFAKEIYGEDFARYLVYAKATDESSSSRLKMEVEIPTPDGNGKYTLKRVLTKDNYDYNIYLEVYYNDSTVSANKKRYSGQYEYYENGYEPIEMPVSLSEMFEKDFGGMDLKEPEKFLCNILDFGGSYDTYEKTAYSTSDGITKRKVEYDDGSCYVEYSIEANRRGKFKDEDYSEDLPIDFEVKFWKNKDRKVKFDELAMEISTTSYYDESHKHDEVIAELLSFTKEQAKFMFNLSDIDFKDAPDVSYTLPTKTVKVFGQDTKLNISCIADKTLIGYRSEVKVDLVNQS